jgi:DNA polymerase-3 subunit delta'
LESIGTTSQLTTWRWPCGHEGVARRLEHQLQAGSIPHAQLFVGPRGVGKRLFARVFARALLDPEGRGGIADLIELAPEGRLGLYPAALLEEVRQQAQMTALSGTWKVYLLDDVERMSVAAANSLLKILEEPPQGTLFLLISGRPQALLPTIVSRCHVVAFDPLRDEEVEDLLQQQGTAPEKAAQIAKRSYGSMERALRIVQQQQDPLIRLILDWLPRLHQISAAEISTKLMELDPDRSKQETDPYDLRLAFEDQCQLLIDWARDAQQVALGITDQLCYPQHQQALQQQLHQGLASLHAMETSTYQAQLAMERLVKPSVLLTGLLLRLRTSDVVWGISRRPF